MKKRHIPRYLLSAIALRRERTRSREKWVGLQLRQYYATILGGMRAHIGSYMREFYGEDNAAWDPIVALHLDSLQDLTSTLDKTLTDSFDHVETFLDDVITDAAGEGYDNELYLLGLLGLSVDDFDGAPDPDTIQQWVDEQGIGGQHWSDRLGHWSDFSVERFGKQLQGAIVTGATMGTTLLTFDRMATGFMNRVEGLAKNEMHWAEMVGSQKMFEQAQTTYPVSLGGKYALDEVWLTREDGEVCPFCRSLHEIVTDKQPVRDSHPNCRCYKVPLMQMLSRAPSRVSEFRIFQTDRQQKRHV